MKYQGICPASCGEFVQGIVDEEEYLSSYAIDKYSRAVVEETKDKVRVGPPKARGALNRVFQYFNIDLKYAKNISLSINSEIPVGKGMASSTADIGATIKATLNMLNKTMTEEEISILAAKIEPTDSIFIKQNSIFNPLTGEVIKKIGNIENAKVLILEPQEIISTKKIRSIENYAQLKLENKEIIKQSFEDLSTGIKNKDLNLIGKAITNSSLANENIHKKEHLQKIIEISKSYGAYGVNIAHSGTVIGILLDLEMDDIKLKEKLIDNNINKKYIKIYTSNIINGGLRSDI